MERRRQSSEVQQTSPTKALLINSNVSAPPPQPGRVGRKVTEDADTRQLRAELEQLVAQTRDKQKKLERLTEQNNRLTQDNAELHKQSERVHQQLEEAKKANDQAMEQEHEEQQKSNTEDLEQMKEFMMAIKMQSNGLAVVNGLAPEAIEIIPSFSYEKTSEPEICLSCFQELKDNANVKCLPCCHLFHEQCISQHLGQSRFCPACSQQVVLA